MRTPLRTNAERLFDLQLKTLRDDAVKILSEQPGVAYVGGIGQITNPKVMFIGEAPGPLENAKGIPFSGGAGKIFRELLIGSGFKATEIYVTNTVKFMPCREGSMSFRRPTPEEITVSLPHLAEEIAIVQPDIICAMGGVAVSAFWSDNSVRKLRGSMYDYQVSETLIYHIFVTFHPSLVQYDPSTRDTLRRDFTTLASLLK